MCRYSQAELTQQSETETHHTALYVGSIKKLQGLWENKQGSDPRGLELESPGPNKAALVQIEFNIGNQTKPDFFKVSFKLVESVKTKKSTQTGEEMRTR